MCVRDLDDTVLNSAGKQQMNTAKEDAAWNQFFNTYMPIVWGSRYTKFAGACIKLTLAFFNKYFCDRR